VEFVSSISARSFAPTAVIPQVHILCEMVLG